MIVEQAHNKRLKEYNIKGYFYVRQKRVPTVLCQGLCIGIDERSKTPILFDSNFKKVKAFTPIKIKLSDTKVKLLVNKEFNHLEKIKEAFL